ncbi:ABC1 kinase family protein [Hyalangium minutum]|uniref:ABC1 family protein n=1 Tax=Hyalangium minutum TaxID=394096 RepID=A0A085WVZ1_9BACT|nr:AarF/ABC1/UbiB kinase family protein [Hyalangium minutum]KFE71854.1 ABC1 family protein [Hyalangium minutum]
MSDEGEIPRGKMRRLGRMLTLPGRAGTQLVSAGLQKVLGKAVDPGRAAASRVMEVLGEMKGIPVKAGQLMTLFGDNLPEEARKTLGQLFAKTPTLPFPQVRHALETELGKSLSEVFESFEETPCAGASLGQVHRARLHSGEKVAVKVQYPGIAGAMQEDLELIRPIVKTLGMAGSLLDTKEYYEEMKRDLADELNYKQELASLEQFRTYLSHWPELVVPRSFPEFSTSRVLVLEWLEGPTLHSWLESPHPESERLALAEKLVRAVYGPFLLHRVVHGDTHPGNFLVLEGGKLGVLDFGAIKPLSEPFWHAVVSVMQGMLENRKVDIVPLVRQAGFRLDMPEERARTLVERIHELISSPFKGPYDFGSDQLIAGFTELKKKYPLDLLRVRPPAEGLLFYRAIGGLSQNLRRLQIKGDFRPFFREALAAPHHVELARARRLG